MLYALLMQEPLMDGPYLPNTLSPHLLIIRFCCFGHSFLLSCSSFFAQVVSLFFGNLIFGNLPFRRG